MKLLFARPLAEPDKGGHLCLGTIDIELTPDARLYGLRLLRMRDGQIRLFAPNAGKRRAATFSPELTERLTQMAVEAIGVPANDR
jgi:hypothetical protein